MRGSLRPDVFAAMLCTLIPALLALALRIHARVSRKVKLWYDDYLAIAALISMSGFDASMFFLIHHGLGLHITDVKTPLATIEHYLLVCDIVQEITYFSAIGLCQLSLLALYWRLFKSTHNARVAIIILMVFTIAWLITFNSLALLQCQPIRYYWDKSINGKCTVQPSTVYIAPITTQYIVDIALIVLPAMQINQLVLPRARKLAVIAMFTFGVLICASGVMVIIVSSNYESYSEDVTWNYVKPAMWASVEMHLSMIACCLPVLRPVIRHVFGWVGYSVMSTKRDPVTNSTRLRTIQTSQIRIKAGDSTHNLAESVKSDSGNTLEYGRGDGPETTTSIGASTGERRLSQAQIDGIRVKYEVNLDFSGKNV